MKLTLNGSRLVMILVTITAIIGFSAFRQNEAIAQKLFREGSPKGSDDTTTRGKRHLPETEYHLDKLENAMRQLDEQLLQLDKHRAQLDFTKMQEQLFDTKMPEVEKMNRKIEEAMAAIDWKKLNKAQAEAQKQSFKQAQKELENVRTELQQQKFEVRIDVEKIKKEVEQELQKAKGDMEDAKAELSNIKNFTNALEKDGLIDKSKPFKIEIKEGDLYLNGDKQPQQISDKYRQYYRKRNFTISISGDEKISEI